MSSGSTSQSSTRATQRLAIGASIGVAIVSLIGLLFAWRLTGSTAILSDALETTVNLAAALMAGFSLWYAAQPADAEHPYGHGKIAYFSAGMEGALIFVAAVGILWTSVHALVVGPELRQLNQGLLLVGGIALINAGLGFWLVRVGRRTNALVLIANGKHILTDVWTTVGVIVGLALVQLTGMLWLDPVVAILVGLNILWTGAQLVQTSFRGLMERVDTDETEQLLAVLEKTQQEGELKGYHHVRHRRVNDQVWVEQHLLYHDQLSLVEAHRLATRVEEAQRAIFRDDDLVMFTSHIEPVSHEHPDLLRESAVGDVVRPASYPDQ